MGGGEWYPWDFLPVIENILFSKTSVGFISKEYNYTFLGTGEDDKEEEYYYRYFIMDRKSMVFQQVNEQLFRKNFSDSVRAKPLEELGERSLLRASNGMVFQYENPYCHDMEGDQRHKLWLNGKVFQHVIGICGDINAVEVIGNQLWFGVKDVSPDVPYGDPSGIIIQSLQKRKLIKKIDKKEGLTGDIGFVVRFDTQNDKVWVATEWGLNEVDRKFHVVSSYYFHEDFNTVSGKPTVFFGSSSKSSNALAVISRVLEIRDSKAFYEAVKLIPQTVQDEIYLPSFFEYNSGINVISPEMDVLIPFLKEAAQSNKQGIQRIALNNLCMFKDKKVADFMRDMKKSCE